MRYFLITLFICSLVFATVLSDEATAQRHAGYCDKVDSTSDALACVNKHDLAMKENLSDIFKDVTAVQDEQMKAMLNTAQKNWLTYRDSHCEWESALTDTPSLKRVYELSCLAEITERRVKLLESVQSREEEKEPREFGTQPRWMNALAHDYPGIFWRYGKWKGADLNCDGLDEQVMTGMSVAHIQDSVTIGEKSVAEDTHHEVEIVIAISDNPETGRPKARLFRFPVSDKYEGAHFCRPAVHLEIIEPVVPAIEGDDEAEAICGRVLRITDRRCAPLTLYWDGKDYVLQDSGMLPKGVAP